MNERFKFTPAVFAVMLNGENKVLLHQRFNTGFMDGYYDTPSGHLEAGEAIVDGLIREVKEEIGVGLVADDLELFHVNQNAVDTDIPYINFFFRAKKWQGTPQILEPEKSNDLGFFAIDSLPNVTPMVREAIRNIGKKSVTFSFFTTKTFEAFLRQ